MKKHVYSMLAAVTISGAIGANAHAEEVVVKKGDTLWGISRNYQDVTVEDIKAWNKLSSDLIYPNDKLTILIEKHYIVQPGDTLWDIAKTNGTCVDDLKGWNSLNSDLIKPGLELVIYPNSSATSNIAAEASANTAVNEAPAQESENTAVIEAPVQEPASTAVTEAPAQEPADTAVIEAPAPAQSTTAAEEAAPAEEGSKTITVTATAYTANCEGCSGITSTGVDLKANPDAKVISVDPNVIPLGTKVYVEGYGYATAADTGGAIKGNIIDIFIPTEEAALQWGRKEVKVTILN
nr:LysM peptidoglycan-binding domain-containing protein [Neobacillus sp. Marseille-Q6967]